MRRDSEACLSDRGGSSLEFKEAGFKEDMALDTGTAGYDETISDTFVKN